MATRGVENIYSQHYSYEISQYSDWLMFHWGMKMRRTLILLLGLLFFTGCAASTDTPPIDISPTGPVSSSPGTPAPSAPSEEEQIEDFAIALLDLKNDLEDQLTEWENDGCSGISVMYREDIICRLSVLNLKSQGSITARSTNALTKSTHPSYVGEPPAAIKEYLENIVSLGEEVESVGGTFTDDRCGAKDDCAYAVDSMIESIRLTIAEIEKVELRS